MRKKLLVPAICLALALSLAGTVKAHNVHPGFLEVIELEGGQLDVTWKVPLYKGDRLDIDPVFPVGFRALSKPTVTPAAASLVERWKMVSDGGGLAGGEIRIEGLEATMTDVLVRISLADGRVHRVVLRPSEPSTVVPDDGGAASGGNIMRALLSSLDGFRLPLLLLAAFALALLPGSRRRGIVLCTVALLAGSLAGYAIPKVPVQEVLASQGRLSEEEGSRVLHGLLLNTYRAFSHEEEEAAYDQLARSVVGDLLAEVYLQNRDSMTMEEAEGARTVIDRLDVKGIQSMERMDGGGIAVVATWDVFGSVRHWGHEHYRCNTYRAQLTLVPDGDYWKLAGVQILDEERVI
ncbi:hypothetical protein N9903_00945 [bacterium]|nr:hypothetical protein [bacterium]